MSLEMDRVWQKIRSLGQIIEILRLVAKGFGFKFLLFNALSHNPEGSGERLEGHYGPLVYNE